MYDSVTAADIPPDATIVAGYCNGRYQWAADDWARFPNAEHVTISVYAWDDAGDVLDVEPGDAEPREAPAWIRMRQSSGLAIPTIYCGQSAIAAVRKACKGLTFDIWSAHYTGVPHLDDGCVATQYADPAMGSGGHYDLSQVIDEWPRGRTQVPAIDYVPQEYRDKFGAQTPEDVYANLEGIIAELQRQLADRSDAAMRLQKIRDVIEAP